ncbi:outer membrane lipoprotein-sorting protein [uncultured Desulfuromonas sp.]|uniref:outer membrane lipoprotein-sorting protein n=1 Tax=uncultured Desulfuromonas sp. TaxID=181013 RepID=UPI002AAC0E7D|nr:outer membrane lipoprotein-sorting protein [uncultured Desulfuromonas sp.]
MLQREKLILMMLLGMLVFSPLSGLSAELTGRQIMTLVDECPDGEDRISRMKMTLINNRGRERVRELKSFSKDYGKDKKTVMVFEAPADVRDTAFLSWEYDDPGRDDDKWLYLPALKKERRISGSGKNDYFMGSDFTYDDMGDRNVDEDTHTLLGEETVQGHDCWKIESVPIDPDDMYTRKRLWVSKEAHMVVQAEYYDKDGLLKVYRALEISKQGGFWTLFRSEMDNVSRSHKTLWQVESVTYDSGLEDRLFRVATIQRGAIR